jgi:hypothetical protein
VAPVLGPPALEVPAEAPPTLGVPLLELDLDPEHGVGVMPAARPGLA